jgi:glycosyltransferase involved in cell wall biosynthesis
MTEVDIVIPFHRDPDRNLHRAVNSAVNSTGVRANIILVDDRNIENKPAIPSQLRRFKLVKSFGQGYASALNCGILRCSSEFTAILNSDDLQEKDRIQTQIQEMRDGTSEISISKLTKFGGLRPHFQLAGNQPTEQFRKELLLLGPYGANASLIMTTDFARARMWDTTCDMPDWKFAYNNYSQEVIYCSNKSYFYRIHKNQISKKTISNYGWLVDEWQKMYLSLGGKPISQEVIYALALPNKKNSLTYQGFLEMLDFFQTVLSHLESLPELFYFETKALLKRRLVIAIAYSKNLRVLDLFDEIFSPSEILRDALEFSVKLSLNFDVARKI